LDRKIFSNSIESATPGEKTLDNPAKSSGIRYPPSPLNSDPTLISGRLIVFGQISLNISVTMSEAFRALATYIPRLANQICSFSRNISMLDIITAG
jgi:hypothetical protein